MSANIAHVNGTDLYFGREPGWHGLGQPGISTVAEALAGGLGGWNLTKVPVVAYHPDRIGEAIVSPDLYSVVRPGDGTIMVAGVSDQYTIHDNEELAEFVGEVIARDDLTIATAGALGTKGETVWFLAELHDGDWEAAPGDVVRPYLYAETRHDGGGSTLLKGVSTRVVCANTRAVALRERGGEFRVQHRSELGEARWIRQAQDAVSLFRGAREREAAQSRRMVGARLSLAEFDAFARALIPGEATRSDNIRGTLRRLFVERPTIERIPAIAGTRWAALQAVTAYTTHLRSTRAVGQSAEAARFVATVTGSGADLVDRAVALLAA